MATAAPGLGKTKLELGRGEKKWKGGGDGLF
jgi:hypothetical protein